VTISDLITKGLRELGIAPLVGTPAAELSSLGLGVVNRILNTWNGKRQAVYATRTDTFTLTPALNPHTIGPTGATWTMTQRPVALEAVTLVDGETRMPIDATMTAAEYAGMASHDVDSDYPRRVYYNPSWVNGQFYFNHVPSAAHDVEIVSRVQLATVALTDTFTMPPAYEAALLNTFKEELTLMPMFRDAASPGLTKAASDARAVAFGNNEAPPRLVTRDAGIPGGGCAPYDYTTGVLG
jgi:hypothetical protein